MANRMIKIENISKHYRLQPAALAAIQAGPDAVRLTPDGRFMALSDVSFEVNAGEAVGILGRNGAGKSTLLKLITRITPPTAGRIYLNGEVVSMIEVGTGFHRDLTGRENIAVNGAVLGMSRREIASKLEEIIDFSECRQFIDMPVKYYSSGMYMKLAFSVAAHLDAEIVLMDEILAVGDLVFREKCVKKIKELSAAGRTVLYVGHNMNSIRSICNRGLVLDQGRLEYDGPVEDAIHYYVAEKCTPAKSSAPLPPASSVYMRPSRQLGQLERPDKTHEMVRMEYIELEGENLFMVGQPLRFLLRWDAAQGFEHLCLRAGIWSANGEAAAVSFADIPAPLAGQGRHEARFCLDTACLMPGKYCLELLMIEKDPLGNMRKQDVLRDTLGLEILAPADHPLYKAYNRDWGYVKLPMTVEQV